MYILVTIIIRSGDASRTYIIIGQCNYAATTFTLVLPAPSINNNYGTGKFTIQKV